MLIRDSETFPEHLRGGVVSIGNFDGVHQGHRRLLEQVVAQARQLGRPAVVFTFEPSPAWVLNPEGAPLPLCWLERKANLLRQLGVDVIWAYPTSREFLQLEAEEFFWRFVMGQLQAKVLVEGSNFRFGRNRQAHIGHLQAWCAAADIRLEVVPPIEVDGQPVSSSWIRQLLLQGQVEKAAQLLGRPHRIRGQVIRGAGRGKQLGYPTANLQVDRLLLPAEGIYAGRAWLGDAAWPAAISLGPNPTFGETAQKLEAFLIGFDGDLYDHWVELEFMARLRAVRQFPEVGALLAQMAEDISVTQQILAQIQFQETSS
ncbi:MAG: bifunctional riboflavin kinase/FAD synthetase [Thermoguttaceae bacterium]|nr:bifunctional riboflavin kinase/FAD synthetase [Thermoguttaceae bacterium]MDW8039423.1 bifunctional riboflavin kinase/FAD synthetase [Thermoguttaceae bacterium]